MQQRVELLELAAFAFVAHPQFFAGVPEARAMKQKKDIGAFGLIAAVEGLDSLPDALKQNVILRHDLVGRIAKIRQEREVQMRIAIREIVDLESLEELTSFFNPEFGIENHLVLSANTAKKDLDEAVKRFSCLPLHSFIFTKLDECMQLGTLLNIPTRHSYPVSYLTNGQKVPEDILFPSREMIADIIMKGAE